MNSARNDGEPTFFELEREKLIGLVSENLGNLISSVNNLNRKIEENVAVGGQFGGVAGLWNQYERVMAHSDNSEKATVPSSQPVSDAHDPGTTLADESYGLAPGAGSTSYMH